MLRIFLLIFNILFNHNWFFRIIGMLNKRYKFMPLVFVAYAATEEYATKYIYKWFVKHTLWEPYITGLLKQNGKFALMTGISATEDLFNKENITNLKTLNNRVRKLQKALKANQSNYAGILPGVLYQFRIIRETPEADITAEIVVKAEEKVRNHVKYGNVPLIILGGKGFIGRRVVEVFRNKGNRDIYIVDKNHNTIVNENLWPIHLNGREVVLINLTKEKVLLHYISLLWTEVVILNEVYPEPDLSEIELLNNKQILAFHVVGVVAQAFPSFPHAYKGGIPCCAAYKNDYIEALIKRLN